MTDDRKNPTDRRSSGDDAGERQEPEHASEQAYRAFGERGSKADDDRGQRLRDAHPEDTFSGASGMLFEQAMAQTRMAICLTDPNKPDAPIVFANRAFRELTGYANEEIVGRNCRFLQGPDTSPEAVSRIRTALENRSVTVAEILNYRKDGTPFWNALHIGPIFDTAGRLIYFFGSQWDVTNVHAARADERHAKLMSRELSHRVKNMFAVMGGVVTATGRAHGAPAVAREINERIQAMGRAYETTLDDAQSGAIDLGKAIRAVLRPYDAEGERIQVRADDVVATPNVVSALGLTLHELAINAIKYGALSEDAGTVEVEATQEPNVDEGRGGLILVRWRERGGPQVRAPDGQHGAGTGIVDMLLRAARGELSREWRAEGLDATIRLRVDDNEDA